MLDFDIAAVVVERIQSALVIFYTVGPVIFPLAIPSLTLSPSPTISSPYMYVVSGSLLFSPSLILYIVRLNSILFPFSVSLNQCTIYTSQMSSITLETHHLPDFACHNHRHLAGSPLWNLDCSSELSASSFGLNRSTWIEPLQPRNTSPPSTSDSYWSLQSPSALSGFSQGQDPAARSSSSSSSSSSFETTPVILGTPLGCESNCSRPGYENQPPSGLSKQIQGKLPTETSLYVGHDLHLEHLLIRTFMTKNTVL